MLEEFKTTQNIAYNVIVNSVSKNKISHAYLFDTNSYPKAMDFIMAFVKYLLCASHYANKNSCGDCSLCRKIDDGNYTELKMIEPDGMWIKKEQLSELQKEFSTKPVEGKYRIYIIKEAEKLNTSAANSILKFLEEPEEGIIAILVTDNLYQLLDTIVSRCQIISLKEASIDEIVNDTQIEDNELFRVAMVETSNLKDLSQFMEDEKNKILLDETLQFLYTYESSGTDALLGTNKLLNLCKERVDMSYVFDIMIMYYQDMIHLKLKRKPSVFIKPDQHMEKIIEQNKLLALCHKLNIFIELKDEIKYNVNQNLLLDRLILALEEVEV